MNRQYPTPPPPLVGSTTAGAGWRSLQRTGAIAAFVFVALVLIPVVLLFVAPPVPSDGAGVLGFIAQYRWVYLTELVCFVGLALPALIAFVAVAVSLRETDPGIALLGGVLGVASETIALALGSSPQSLHGGLVLLSDSYAGTTDPEHRAGLVASADALIAATNAVSWAGIVTATAIGVCSMVMRRAGFGSRLASLGMVTAVIGVVCEALRPNIGIAYLPYGLLLPLWFGLVGRRLLRLAQPPRSRDGTQPT